jgi:tartrate dehydratase beta subunit/fumarate hydratase class I family protein
MGLCLWSLLMYQQKEVRMACTPMDALRQADIGAVGATTGARMDFLLTCLRKLMRVLEGARSATVGARVGALPALSPEITGAASASYEWPAGANGEVTAQVD